MKLNIKTGKCFLKILAVMALFVVLSGCTTKTTMLNIEPSIPVPAEIRDSLRQVVVSDVISAIPMDSEIGHGHQGAINLRNDTYLAGSKISEAHTLIITSLEEELSSAGYKFQAKKSSLFGAEKEKNPGNNMLVGGEIVECKFDSYNSIFGKNSKSSATVAWSLFDPLLHAVVFQLETSGAAKGPEKSVSSLAFAVRASFLEFLNDPKFIKSLMDESTQPEVE